MVCFYTFIFLSSIASPFEMMTANPWGLYLFICFFFYIACTVAVVMVTMDGRPVGSKNITGVLIYPFIIALLWPISILITVLVCIINYQNDRSHRNNHAADRDTDGERLSNADAHVYKLVSRDATTEEKNLQKSNSDNKCSICLDCVVMQSWRGVLQPAELDTCLTTCQHIFHWNCIKEWLTQDSSCPLCRTDQQVKDLRFIYRAGDNGNISCDSVEDCRDNINKVLEYM